MNHVEKKRKKAPIKVRLAAWLAYKLSNRTQQSISPSGSGVGTVVHEPDGRRIALITRSVDVVDLYFDDRKTIVSFSISRGSAFMLAWWILWHWCVLRTWCGLKNLLWSWSVRTLAFSAKQTG